MKKTNHVYLEIVSAIKDSSSLNSFYKLCIQNQSVMIFPKNQKCILIEFAVHIKITHCKSILTCKENGIHLI